MANKPLKIPPQSLETERALLGSVMIRPEILNDILDLVNTDYFYSKKHSIIFESMKELNSKNTSVDLLSLSERLKEIGELEAIGGKTYLSELLDSVPTAANAENYALIVQKKYVLRNLIGAAEEIESLGYKEELDLDPILDEAAKKIDRVVDYSRRNNMIDLNSLITEAWSRIELIHKNYGTIRGVPSGFKKMDEMLSGFQKSDFIVLAARPSVGKTSLALDITRNISVRSKIPVAFFSLEMSHDQLVDRLLAAESSVEASRIRNGKCRDIDFENIGHAIERLSNSPLFIDDTPSNNIVSIKTAARRLKHNQGLGLIVVDYLQIMIPTQTKQSDSMVMQITEISRSLKSMAKELNVPVLALSQLSRKVEERGGKPRLSDLRDSGSIEQDADVVMFIHRKEQESEEVQNITEIHVAKHRNGPTGIFELYFDRHKTTFLDLENRDTNFEQMVAQEF